MYRVILILIAVFMLPLASAYAAYQEIPLPAYNFNTNSLDTSYPDGPSVLGGIPFDIPDTSDPGISVNAWHSHYAAPGNYEPVTLEIPVNVYGVKQVFTLINTFWGQTIAKARLEFEGDDTAFLSLDLVGGWNVRDYYKWSLFPQTINDPNTQLVVDLASMRLDMQTTLLPADFWDENLAVIRLVDYGGINMSRTFLAGVTVNAVPVPAAAWLLGSGLLGLFGLRRKMK